MTGERLIRPVAVVRNGFKTKFGVPRQSGLDGLTVSTVVMEPEYRAAEAFRGIEEFSHLWLLWLFDGEEEDGKWSPTVRPPKLGGNKRVGVFASRSPNRPNRIGMTVVRLISVDHDAREGPLLRVTGCDMTDGTVIIDIKPYIPYADSRPDAAGGYSVDGDVRLKVVSSPEAAVTMPEDIKDAVYELISLDPRPGYQSDPERVYHMEYSGYDVSFRISGGTAEITGAQKL